VKVENAVVPNADQLAGFAEPGGEGPIYMVNLLKYRDKAAYDDGRDTDLTGQQAYGLYSAEVAKLILEVGGELKFGASVERLMLGEVEELWDTVAIAMYPSRAAMLEMMQKPRYQEIAVHRTAGLAGQLNIETVEAGGDLVGLT